MDSLAKLRRTARRGFVVSVALGIGAYLVVSAQRGQRGGETNGGTEGGDVVLPTTAGEDASIAEFLSTSKSVVLDSAELEAISSEAGDDPRFEVPSDHEPFLSSSKFLAPGSVELFPLTEGASESVFLSGSKSGVIPSYQKISFPPESPSVGGACQHPTTVKSPAPDKAAATKP